MLTCLTFSIESTRYLSTTERTVVKQTTIFASERNTLSYTLVDDSIRNFSKTINVSLTSTIVTTFDSIIEKTIDRVTIILIVFSSIHTTLRSNRVSTTWRVLDTEVKHIEAHFAKRSCSRSTCKTCTNNDYIKTTFVGRVHQFLVSFIVSPFFSQRTFWNLSSDNITIKQFFDFSHNFFLMRNEK